MHNKRTYYHPIYRPGKCFVAQLHVPPFWTDSNPSFCSALSQQHSASLCLSMRLPGSGRHFISSQQGAGLQDSATWTVNSFLYRTSVILCNKLLVLFLGIWFQAWTCQISLSQRVKTLSCLNQSMNFISSNLYVLAALSSFVNNQRLFLMSFPIPKSSSLGPPYWLMQHPESLLAWPYLPCHVFSASHVLSSLSCLCFLHLFGKLWNKSCCFAIWRCFAPSCIFCHLAL